MKRLTLAAFAALCSLVLAPSAGAQDYPTRPISLYLGQAAGGGADLLARYLADQLSKVAGQSVIVENKPGAGGSIAAQAVAQAKPDGYTLFLSSSNPLTGNFILYKNLAYKLEDFAPVTSVAQFPFAVIIGSKAGVDTVAELTEYVKGKGGHATYASPTTFAAVATEVYLTAAGATARQIPYKSQPPAIADVASGDVDFMLADVSQAIARAKRGDVKMLAVTSSNRVAATPDTPTMQEAGVANYDMVAWFGVFAPANTPDPVRAKLQTWINEIVARPETAEFLRNAGAEPLRGDAQSLMAVVRNHMAKWQELAAASKIRPAE